MYKLKARNMEVTVLHGDLSKLERTNIMSAFRRGVFRAMVVTDVAARGLDVAGCDAVFNLQVPDDEVQYVHRAGRTGRLGGEAGKVVTLTTKAELPRLQRIAQRLGISIQPAALSYGEFFPVAGDSIEAVNSQSPTRSTKRRRQESS
mmetsp:Transcript_20080/g.43751  ORF Transcript_20080/g.43751 Transcript_20080/m.43751 type:complete len:147 (-) Transcript_20080:462-902(-)